LAAVARHESKKLGELLRHPDVEAAISSGGELIEALVTMCSFGALNLRNIVCHGFCFDLPDALVVLAAHLCTSATALIPREPVMVTELSEPYWEEITFSREFPLLFERLPRLEHGLREAWMLLNCDFDDYGHVCVFWCCCCCCFFFSFGWIERLRGFVRANRAGPSIGVDSCKQSSAKQILHCVFGSPFHDARRSAGTCREGSVANF